MNKFLIMLWKSFWPITGSQRLQGVHRPHFENFWVKQGDYKLVASLVAQSIKNLPAMQETQVRFQGWEDHLEREVVTHFNILAWRIPMDRGTWKTTVHGVIRVGHELATKLSPQAGTTSLPPLHFWEYLFLNWTPCLPNLYLLGLCLSALL